MNAGLEDVYTLFSILDKHTVVTNNPTNPGIFNPTVSRGAALAEYSNSREPDAHAINDLALQNYIEMRDSVLSPTYRFRKFLEEWLSVYVPRLGWQTKYSRVSFGNERYSEVVAKSDHQGKVLARVLKAMVWTSFTAAIVGLRYSRSPRNFGPMDLVGGIRDFVRSLLG
jgi:kynurenine 3-monooxygenase